MKRKLVVLLLATVTLTGCGGKTEQPPTEQIPIEQSSQELQYPDIPMTEESLMEESLMSETEVEELISEESTEDSMDFSFSFIGDDPSIPKEEPESPLTILDFESGDTRVSMPLTYDDLERQGLSIDYSQQTVVNNEIQQALGLKSDNWFTVRDISGRPVALVCDENNRNDSRVITKSDRILACISIYDEDNPCAIIAGTVGNIDYEQIREKTKESFSSVKYLSVGSKEYIVGSLKKNRNTYQVWMEFSFDEDSNLLLSNLAIVNQTVNGKELADGYEFRSNAYGEKADIESTLSNDSLSFKYGDTTYTNKSTIVDFINSGWKITNISSSESGGIVKLTLQNGKTQMEFYTTSMYIQTTGKHHDISEKTLPSKLVFGKNSLSKLNFMGITGVYSRTDLQESAFWNYVSSTTQSNEGESEEQQVTGNFGEYGNVIVNILDNYVNGLIIEYVR